MAAKFMQIALTPAAQAAQDRFYGRHQAVPSAPEGDTLTEDETAFIAARDSFYMATTNSDGWPYIQHRGGPPGFLKVLGPDSLGFADFKGNRQMLTTGNLAGNDRVALFLVDYPQRTRLKILGHARAIDARENATLADQLSPSPELRGKIERLFLIRVVGFDWNCPQYITPRYTAEEVNEAVAPLKARIAELEEQLRRFLTTDDTDEHR
jgi:predicted pyridoxine 5'-phosphate oxidase superfamily flavin-nucleotide-binding protein